MHHTHHAVCRMVMWWATHPKVLEPKVLDPKVLVTKVLGSLNKGINWLYPVSDVKSLIGFTAYFGN